MCGVYVCEDGRVVCAHVRLCGACVCVHMCGVCMHERVSTCETGICVGVHVCVVCAHLRLCGAYVGVHMCGVCA